MTQAARRDIYRFLLLLFEGKRQDRHVSPGGNDGNR